MPGLGARRCVRVVVPVVQLVLQFALFLGGLRGVLGRGRGSVVVFHVSLQLVDGRAPVGFSGSGCGETPAGQPARLARQVPRILSR